MLFHGDILPVHAPLMPDLNVTEGKKHDAADNNDIAYDWLQRDRLINSKQRRVQRLKT